jgi:hypothetical protein
MFNYDYYYFDHMCYLDLDFNFTRLGDIFIREIVFKSYLSHHFILRPTRFIHLPIEIMT